MGVRCGEGGGVVRVCRGVMEAAGALVAGSKQLRAGGFDKAGS